jgi:hypothetical protein
MPLNLLTLMLTAMVLLLLWLFNFGTDGYSNTW